MTKMFMWIKKESEPTHAAHPPSNHLRVTHATRIFTMPQPKALEVLTHQY